MKRLLVLLVAAAPLVRAGDSWSVSEKEEIRRTIPVVGGGHLRQIVIDNINGPVRLTGYDGSDIQLVAHRTSYASSDGKLAECKKKITLDVREDSGSVTLYVNTPWRCQDGGVAYDRREDYGFDADFDFDVRVPRHADFFVKTVNRGSIDVREMEGSFEVRDVNGGIDMSGIAGSGLVSTVNGKLHVAFAANPVSRCGFSTVNGSIDVEVPRELSADLRLKTFNGEVYSDFEVTGLPRRPLPPERIGRRTVYHGDDFFSVRAGGGGTEMVCETLNGDIRILRAHK